VLGTLARRSLEASLFFFACLGFFYVPLGQHTGFEHARAIFSTPAAARAGRELKQAASKVRAKLTDLVPRVL
jgi:hypothetical protein